MRISLSLFLSGCFFALMTGCGGTNAITGEVINIQDKPRPGERWSITLTADGKSYNGETDEKGAFKISGVPSGTYDVKVVHYVPVEVGEGKKVDPAITKGTSGRPVEKEYPEKWTVPGGPYKLDLSKLPKDKK